MNNSYTPFIERRKRLRQMINETYQDKKGVALLFAAFEHKRFGFQQDSTFYYFSGLEEPGCCVVLDTDGSTTLWVPQYGSARSQWVSTIVEADTQQAAQWGIKDIRHLGHPCKGFTTSSACTVKDNEHLLAGLQALVEKGEYLFMMYPPDTLSEQHLYIDRLFSERPTLKEAIIDISPLVGTLRRTKSQDELEYIYDAIDCTMQAHEAMAVRIEPGIYEYQLQAAVEFVFREGGGSAAYPPIIGGGRNSTVLHYHRNTEQLKKGDVVLIDCGAQIGHYCADITRTYPVSGTFTDRQREIYDIVLETQDYIAGLAQPGFWLSNPQHQDMSLHHLALQFLKEKGYADYFPHAIGHFLGLDVHDVGGNLGPLKEGDVITIEPGIYLPNERLGIRIEDNYWITASGAVCMSEELPRDSYEIEELMRAEFEEE